MVKGAGRQAVSERCAIRPETLSRDRAPVVIEPDREGELTALEKEVWRLLEDVPDPEIPILSVVDLGLIRYVREQDGHGVCVGVSPTYTGCPATEVIRAQIEAKLREAGYASVQVESVLSPAWTSDWLTESGREKLREYGIAPPERSVSTPRQLWRDPQVSCPRCDSSRTERVSEFASTPCKALYRCLSCFEPFEYFKCL
jgi:ring-1,2-phenylacetyl-CoA epoxidase subunit PaaD